MRRFLFLGVLVFFVGSITAQQKRSMDYYDAIGNETCEPLKTALYNLINGHTVVTYASLWTHFTSTDDHLNDAGNEVIVWDMYSDNPSGAENEFTFVTEQCGTYQGEGECYNREHTFPKSWWGGSTSQTQYTDLFMVIPVDGWINGLRANMPYGEVQPGTETQTTANGCKVGSSTVSMPGYSGAVFEPTDDYKGDLARGYFYVATRYENVIAGWENNTTESSAVLDGTSYTVFEPWLITLLSSWHANDPVDQKELDRNEAIFAIQGNRNPYIDHPEYVAAIWEVCAESCLYVTTTADDGPGSLRAAVACAATNDTITFSPAVQNSTISLTTNAINIEKNITIDASTMPNIRVSSVLPHIAAVATIFKIGKDSQVNLIGFTIDGGFGPEGSAICNDGTLSLENMVLTAGANENINSIFLNRIGSSVMLRGWNWME